MNKKVSYLWAVLFTAGAVFSMGSATAQVATENTQEDQLFATVAGRDIYQSEYEDAVNRRIRSTLYHGKVSENQVKLLREQVALDLVDRVLLQVEAESRGIGVDSEKVSRSMQRMKDYMGQRGQAVSDEALTDARLFLERENLVDQLKQQITIVESASAEAVRGYYADHPEQFTEPEQRKVSVILLRVAPSSTKDVWQAARKEAADIMESLDRGQNFADMAKMRSSDSSAEKGGDMGYLHKGMLSGNVEQVLDQLEVGEVAQPMMVLEGIAIFKMTDRKLSRLRDFEDVRERATDLYRQDLGQRHWEELLAGLKTDQEIKLY